MHTGVIVSKFGGTSLADATQIKKTAEIIKSDPGRKFVVVSAPGKLTVPQGTMNPDKITNMLIDLFEYSERSFESRMCPVEQRFYAIRDGLGLSLPIHAEIAEIRTLATRGVDRDGLISRGEYLCAKLVAAYLGFHFIDAADFISFSNEGVYDGKASDRKWQRLDLPNAPGYVIPGFYGMTSDGFIKTFSRGGSDFTAAALAAIVEADLCEKWTDVSGLYRADPSVVDDPEPIDEMTFKELREYTYGATVVHDEMVFPLRKTGTPIRIKNTNAPDDPGTLIVPDSKASQRPKGSVVGISFRQGFTVFTVEKAMMNQEQGFLYRTLSAFDKYKVNIEHVSDTIDAISVIVPKTELESGKKGTVYNELQRVCDPDMLNVQEGVALVCVVGHWMNNVPGIAGKILTAVGDAGINTRVINQAASEINVILGIDDDKAEDAVRAIYDSMIRRA